MTDHTRALLEQALEALDNIPHPPWRNPELADAIRAELAKPVGAEPVACVVETESGVMVWPIADYNEASTYCDDGESPSLLYLHPPTPARHDAPEVAALKAERDALLAALKSVVSEAVRLRWSVHPKWLQIMNTANAAIAKAEGREE